MKMFYYLSRFLIAFIAVCVFVPILPPNVKFEAFNVTTSALPTGPTHKKFNYLEKLFEGEISAPEHLEVHDGVMYASTASGYVVKIVNDKIVPVVRFGRDCEGPHEPEICGRPLGLRFDSKGFMYVADAYYGIFKVNVTSGKYEQLVSMDTEINGDKPGLPNSLVVASDGTVYWSDSSSIFGLHDGMYICGINGNGRLIKYDPVTRSNTVLIENIFVANGVALSKDESFVIVSELVKSRILRYNLKGPKKGESEVFLDGLPGYPDNIHATGNGEFHVSLVEVFSPDNLALPTLLAPYPLIRKSLVTVIYLLDIIASTINQHFPNYYAKALNHWAGDFYMLSFLDFTSGSLIVFFNEEGKITRSLYSNQEGCDGITDVALLNGYYYLGSLKNQFLLRAKAG